MGNNRCRRSVVGRAFLPDQVSQERLTYFKRAATWGGVILSFVPLQAAPAAIDRAWRGGVGGDWFVAGNWDPAGIPSAGDEVTVSSGSVLLTNSTADLGRFSITNATMTFSNWTTRLTATDIVIQRTGKLTHAMCATNVVSDNSNRVVIVCRSLTIDAGGGIQVDERGYPGYSSTMPAQGPGAGRGASHGGRGGRSPGPMYGNALSPTQPGSGGDGLATYPTHNGGHGGGAVWIDASENVVVNGIISANAITLWAGSVAGAGSGGSIRIGCRTLTGKNGSISANGGTASPESYGGGGGGGGRIAIIYDTGAQSNLNAMTTPTVTISANRGGGYYPGRPGTVYLSDTGVLCPDRVHGGTFMFPATTDWSVANLQVTNSLAVFPAGFNLTIATNFFVGPAGSLELTSSKVIIGGNLTIRGGHFLATNSLVPPVTLRIGGDLMVTNSGTLTIQAGPTNAIAYDYGYLIDVSGDATIAPASSILLCSHPANGGSVLWRTHNLCVESSGNINASARGFAASNDRYVKSYGPGGAAGSGGASHGGRGGNGNWTPTAGSLVIYGASNAPIDPGSGGGSCWSHNNSWARAAGGGVVRIRSSNRVTVDGVIQADGLSATGGDPGGGGAGGSIFIQCLHFGGGGSLRADGGNAQIQSWGGGSGGGGRIAVVYQRTSTYSGSLSVTHGTATAGRTGTPGTIFVRGVRGSVLTIR